MYGNGTNSPIGLQPSQFQNGSLWTGQTAQYLITTNGAGTPTTSIFRGDPVIFNAQGTIVAQTAGTNPYLGVFWGVQYTDAFGNYQFTSYWLLNTVTYGNTPATAFVIDDPNVLFDVQAYNSTAAAPFALTQANMGENANIVLGAGNTITGNSTSYLDINTIGAGATLQVKLIRFTPVPGNIAGVNYNNALVKINNHIYNGGTGTAGI